MKIFYYPGVDEASGNSLSRFVTKELLKLDRAQWKRMDYFLADIRQGTEAELVKLIVDEQKKPWEKRRVAALRKDLYEYRGSQTRTGTFASISFLKGRRSSSWMPSSRPLIAL